MSLNRLRSGGTLANSPATRMAWGVGVRMAGATAAGGASYILDTYTAFAAYDVAFQLKTGQTQMIEVRESSGGTYAWIGPSGGALDETVLLAHTGVNNGFVRTIKDATTTASTNDASQATDANQPQIVTSGVVDKINGKPSMKKQGTGTRLTTTTWSTEAQPNTVFCVGVLTTGNGVLWQGITPNSYVAAFSGTKYLNAGSNVTTTNGTLGSQSLYTALFDGVSSLLRQNGSELVTGNSNTNGIADIGLHGDGFSPCENLQSVIFFNTDQTANFAAIETAINALYGVY